MYACMHALHLLRGLEGGVEEEEEVLEGLGEEEGVHAVVQALGHVRHVRHRGEAAGDAGAVLWACVGCVCVEEGMYVSAGVLGRGGKTEADGPGA